MKNDILKPDPPAPSRDPKKSSSEICIGNDTGSGFTGIIDLNEKIDSTWDSFNNGLSLGDRKRAYIEKYGEFIHRPDWGLYLIKAIRAPVIRFPYHQSPAIPKGIYSAFPCEFSMVSEIPCDKKGILIIPSSCEMRFASELFSYPHRTRLLIYFWHSGRAFKIVHISSEVDMSRGKSIDFLLSWLKTNTPTIFRLRKHHIIDRLRKSVNIDLVGSHHSFR